METNKLRSLQAPLKEKYKKDPQSAMVTLKASGAINEGIACSVETGQALVKAGLHPATGGDGGPGLFRRYAASGFSSLRRSHPQSGGNRHGDQATQRHPGRRRGSGFPGDSGG